MAKRPFSYLFRFGAIGDSFVYGQGVQGHPERNEEETRVHPDDDFY